MKELEKKKKDRVVLELAKIVGISTQKNWSQVHTFLPDESEKKSRRGQLLAAITLSHLAEEVETVSVGREIIARLHEEYYGELTDNPFDRLRKAVKKVVAEAGSEAEIEIAAAALIGEILYLVISGEGGLILKRGEKIARVLSGSGAASGYLKENDVFFLGTSSLFKLVTKEFLRSALANDSLSEAKEILMSLVHAQLANGPVAGLMARAKLAEGEGSVLPVQEKREENFLAQGKDLKSRLGSIIASFRSKVDLFLPEIRKRLIGRRLPRLRREQSKPKRSQKTAVTVVLVLLLLLGISVVFGRQQKGRLGQKQKVAAILDQARGKKEEGEALLELNPVKAKELLLEAQGLIQALAGIESPSQELVEFRQNLETSLGKVLREHQVEPKIFFDLELIKAGARGDDWDLSAKQAVILDQGKSAVYSLGLTDKQSAILAGGSELDEAEQVAAFLPRFFILSKEEILEGSREVKKQPLEIKTDEDWGKIVDFRAFGGSLYLLEQQGKIWKYAPHEEGFGPKQAWLEKETGSLEAVSMAIDGAVWVLTRDGTALKYVRGVRDFFGIAGLDKPLSEPAAIYTDADQEKIYLLDRGNSRVVVLAKSGEYDSQYLWEGIDDVADLVASEEEGKIWLLGGGKVYEIDIR